MSEIGSESLRSNFGEESGVRTSGAFTAVLVQINDDEDETADPENYSGSSPHLHHNGSHLERRESSRLQAAKQLILRSLRPGHSGWAEVSGNPNPNNNAANNSNNQNSGNSSDPNGNVNSSGPLDRNSQVYHSEGKGLRSKRKAWASERELRSSSSSNSQQQQQQQQSQQASTSSRSSSSSSAIADRSQSFSDRRRLSLDDDGGFGSDRVETQPEVVYENLTLASNSTSMLAKRENNKERRSFRKLTKDSGYETNYSDYANLDSLVRNGSRAASDGDPAGESGADQDNSGLEISPEMTPRSRSPVSNRSSSPRYQHQKVHRAAPSSSSSGIHRSTSRGGSGFTPSSPSASSSNSGTPLARYPSSDSLHSYSSAATLTAGSVHSAKSSPSLCQEQQQGLATTPAGAREHDQGWDRVVEEHDYLEMVAKKDSPPASSNGDSGAELSPRLTATSLQNVHRRGGYWDAEEDQASYASDLRSSSYLVISRHGRPPAPLPSSSSSSSGHSYQHQHSDSYPVSTSSSYWQSQSQSQSQTSSAGVDDFEPSDPGMSVLSSGIYYPPPSPPPAPERDPASLKEINYGPGHEKFPSWPMPPPPTGPGGSQRTNSWTDQTEYPKEKPKPYLRPWMVKKPPQPPTTRVWSESGLPDPVEYHRGGRRSRAPIPPPVDKDGRVYGDADYCLPSPPERDSSSYREKWREPVTEETLSKLAEMEEGGTPFLDQLRNDSLALYWTDRGIGKDDRESEKTFCHSRDGRESVATVVTNSSSNSSNDTLKCHGSLGDLSNYGPVNGVSGLGSTSNGQQIKYDVVHSAKVPPVERHNSECVLYYGFTPVKGNNKLQEKSPNIDTTKPPSVAERIHELERQSRSVPDLLKNTGLSLPSNNNNNNNAVNNVSSKDPSPHRVARLNLAVTPPRSATKPSMGHQQQQADSEKSRTELKAIQKQAVMEFFERQTGKTRAPGYGTASRGPALSGTLPRARVNGVKQSQHLDGDSALVNGESHRLTENGTGSDDQSKEILSTLKHRTLPIPIHESEPVPERPPKKSSPTEDCSRRIEEAARELKNLRTTSSSGRKPRAPDPPFNNQIGLRCSSPDLPPPPPPPPISDEAESADVLDESFPPPPSPRQVRSIVEPPTTPPSGPPPAPSKPYISPTNSFLQTTYHKDSYMVHRKDRKFGGNIEERYRRHISPASHSVPHLSSSTSSLNSTVTSSSSSAATGSNLGSPTSTLASNSSSSSGGSGSLGGRLHQQAPFSASTTNVNSFMKAEARPPKPFVSPNTWERNHNVRQPSTTVVFTSAELRAIKEKEKAAAFKSSPDLHPSVSSPSLRYSGGHSPGAAVNGAAAAGAGPGTGAGGGINDAGLGFGTGTAGAMVNGGSGSLKSSYRSPFESRIGVSATTSSFSLDLLMDDASDGDASSQSPVSSLSASPCHSRGDSHDSAFTATTATTTSSSGSSSASASSSSTTSSPGYKPMASLGSSLAPPRTHKLSREEIECEELSKDLAKQLPKNDFLSSLLDPGPEHKSPADYVGGLFDFSEDEGGVKTSRERVAKFRSSAPDLSENGHHDIERGGESGPLPASSAYFTTSECKAKLLTRYSSEVLSKSTLSVAHNSRELAEKKDELLERISKKLRVLREEKSAVEEETAMNEALGKAVSDRVEAALDAAMAGGGGGSGSGDGSGAGDGTAVVSRKDREKFRTHVQEIDKITSLLLGLGGRLARAENALANLPEDASEQDRKILEGKRDRLVEQLEEAKQLKENIDRRSRRVSEFLSRHLTPEELADYDHFVRMKAKLIVQAREIDEKIKLGEEQTAALRDALVGPFKS